MTFPVHRTGVRPVRSLLPQELWRLLSAAGVEGQVIGSAAAGGPAHDLDLVVDRSPLNLARLEQALVPLAVGDWEPTLRRLADHDGPGPFRIVTTLGWLDLLAEHPR